MKVFKIALNLDFFLIERIDIKINELETLSNINTNKIKNDTIYYTKKYIKLYENKIKKLLNKGISTVFYKDFESYFLLSNIIEANDIRFDIKKSLPSKILNLLLKDENLKKLTCYFIPSDYVDKFIKKNILINFTNDMLFTMKFIKANNLKNLKNIYYKKVIIFNTQEDVKENLTHFLKVNQNLRLIHLYFYKTELLSLIVNELKKYNLTEVDIFIHQNDNNLNDLVNGISHLRKINKKYKNIKREIKIVYSDEFFRNNIFRELTINGIKFCMIAIFYMGLIFVISDKYQEYRALINLRILEESLGEITDNDLDEMDDTDIFIPEESDNVDDSSIQPIKPPTSYVNKYANIPDSFDKLKKINKEVIGWINLNNTKINYPFTQHSDNNYYLERDIYGNKIITGWIFMDYRNSSDFTDKNTIIYGHNTTSGYMFGDLKNTALETWYKNPENEIIFIKTPEKELKFKIFSIYKTNVTSDYLKIGFYNNDYFMEFINMIKERSVYDFNVNITQNDKIITLSSCTGGGGNRRIVMHGVLI